MVLSFFFLVEEGGVLENPMRSKLFSPAIGTVLLLETNFSHHSCILPCIELQERAEVLFFSPCSPYPCSQFICCNADSPCGSAQWCGISPPPLKAEESCRMWRATHLMSLDVQVSCHAMWADMPGEGGWHSLWYLLFPLPVGLCLPPAALPVSCQLLELMRRASQLPGIYSSVLASSRNSPLKEVWWTFLRNSRVTVTGTRAGIK